MADQPLDALAAQLASEADACFRSGREREALALYARAAAITEDTVVAAGGPKGRGLLMGNAVMLWHKAKQSQKAQSLAYRYLAGGPPAWVADKLRRALFASWQEEELGPDEYYTAFELTMAGKEVTFGVAPADDVAPRQTGAQALLWRAVEHEAGLPFRDRGGPPPEVQRLAQLYAAAPLPGSFRLVFKVKAPMTQLDLLDSGRPSLVKVRGGEPLVHRAVSLVRMIAAGAEDELAREVNDPVYRVGFMKLVRDLAPDGRRIEEVDIGGGKTSWQSARLTRDTRDRAARGIRATFEQAGWTTARGRLTGMQLGRSGLHVTVEREGGKPMRWTATLGQGFEERIGPLWGRTVVVAGPQERSSGGQMRYQLVDIEDEAGLQPESAVAARRPKRTRSGSTRSG